MSWQQPPPASLLLLQRRPAAVHVAQSANDEQQRQEPPPPPQPEVQLQLSDRLLITSIVLVQLINLVLVVALFIRHG